MKQLYIPKRFGPKSLQMIDRVNSILDEYAGQGYRLSLRQLYYQLVARAIIENSIRSYKTIGGVVSDARLAGMIDWDMVEDRGREMQSLSHWNSPAEIVDAASRSYHRDHWEGQKTYVEVMVEKDALSGILLPVCRKWDVRFTANKGYSSSSAMYEAGKRFLEARDKECDEKELFYLIYFGDHDPSGIDMTRDVTDRLNLFTEETLNFQISRLALNWDQVEEWKPPENPAKQTDSRYEAYVVQFGDKSWELDAVEPRRLVSLLERKIESLIDPEAWNIAEDRQEAERLELRKFVENYRGEK